MTTALRKSPSGKKYVVLTPDDLPLDTSDIVNVSTVPGDNATEALDYLLTQFVIRSNADWDAVAPAVAGVRTLQSGSYWFDGAVALPANERVITANNSRIVMRGSRPSTIQIFGTPIAGQSFLTIASSSVVDCYDLGLTSLLGRNIENAGVLRLYNCTVNDSSSAANGRALIASGVTVVAATAVRANSAGGIAIQHTIGDLYVLDGSDVSSDGSGGGIAYHATGANSKYAYGEQSTFRATVNAANALQLNGTDYQGVFSACTLLAEGTGGKCIAISAAGYTLTDLRVLGSRLSAQLGGAVSAIGVALDGDWDSIAMEGCTFHRVANCVLRSGGTQGSLRVLGSRALACTNGVSLNAIPTRGLLLVGCDLNTATALVGFTAATALVNIKACNGNAGLLAETAIVP